MPVLTHGVTSEVWTPRNDTQKVNVEHNINKVQTEALRNLAPNSGAYINEVNSPAPALLKRLLTP